MSASSEPLPDVGAMIEELASAPAVYGHSRYWHELSRKNLDMLAQYGLENLKRTVAQNYFNWFITNRRDPQFRNLLGDWLRHPTLRPFLNSVDRSGPVVVETGSLTLRRRDWLVYKLFVGFLWELTRRTDRSGLSERLEEPLLGNPVLIERSGRRISQDLANSIRELNTLLENGISLDGLTVAELGAGYGRLGYVLRQFPQLRYVVFDVPPTLAVSQWYLGNLFPDVPIFRFRRFRRFEEIEAELSRSRVAFFTPNQLELFPERWVDVFVSISTLPEMTRAQVENYARLIGRCTKGWVYCKQWEQWRNPQDDYLFSMQELDTHLGSAFVPVLERPDAVQSLFREKVWHRRPGA